MLKAHYKRVLVILLLGIVVASVWGVQWRTLDGDFESVDSLQTGDILFVDIYEGWCHGSFWDHLGIYVGEGKYVVEATFNGGITLTSVEAFLRRDEPAKVSVKRLEDMPGREEAIQKVIDYAVEQVDKPFDFTATATLPAKINEGNLHCTELVWRAFKAAGIDLDINDGPFVYPDDIYFSPKLTKLG